MRSRVASAGPSSRSVEAAKGGALDRVLAAHPQSALNRCGAASISVLVAVALSSAIFPVRASEQFYKTQYVPTIWQVEQALPGNSVTALLQDHDGYLWIGTFGGLARFDGERFRLLDATATPGFDNNNILCLYQSRPGILWIGTVGGGVFR